MYNEDIQELLIHTKQEIDSLSVSPEINRITLKNTLENMRSVLDYLAQDMHRALYINSDKKPYFPYGQRENHFQKSIKKNLPLLQQNIPLLYALIVSVQPFSCHDNWLIDLCILTNDVKHNKLSKMKKEKAVSIRQGQAIFIENGKNIIMHNNYYNGNRLDDVYIDNTGNTFITKHSGITEIIIDNKIKFSGKELEVIPFLSKCHYELDILSNQITKLIVDNKK